MKIAPKLYLQNLSNLISERSVKPWFQYRRKQNSKQSHFFSVIAKFRRLSESFFAGNSDTDYHLLGVALVHIFFRS
jgi:hypothetical protein